MALSPNSYIYDPTTLISNRARTLANQVSASGTKYFAVTPNDLRGKSPDEILKRLSPVIRPEDGVRSLQILVDLQRHLTIYSDQPVYIGTAVLEGRGFKPIDVRSLLHG